MGNILKKKYAFSKYLSMFMITFGTVICSKEIKFLQQKNVEYVHKTPWKDSFWWTLGISLLTIALFVFAKMDIYQELLHSRYGKNAREALYYTHLVPLSFFLTLEPNIYDNWKFALASEPRKLFLIGMHIPKLIAYLIGNILTQYTCISSVFVLITECNFLTVTLAITLRKFLSLLFSNIYFKNPFTIYHWIGTLLVFIGRIVFTKVVPKMIQSLRHVSKAKKIE